MDKDTNRLDYIDILKGFGIILMVLGHMWFGHFNYETYLYAFHMPLFFLISGYLFKAPENLGVSIRKKMRSLLVPYFVFGFIYFFAWLILNYPSAGDWPYHLKGVLLLSVEGIPYESALWFLMVLFWVWLLYTLLQRSIKDPWVLALVVILISAVGSLWGNHVPFLLPWGWQNAMAVLLFFWLGHQFRSLQERSPVLHSWEVRPPRKKVWILIIVLIVNAALIYQNGKIDLRTQNWRNIPLTYFNAVTAVWGFSELFKCAVQKFKANILPFRILRRIGQYSIVWLCLNHRVIFLAKRILHAIPLNIQSNLLSDVIIIVLSLVMLYLIAEIFMRTPLKLLVGKKWTRKQVVNN